eukprot:scaffold61328_cov68-Phaeocystis_antarctica.AAC.5
MASSSRAAVQPRGCGALLLRVGSAGAFRAVFKVKMLSPSTRSNSRNTICVPQALSIDIKKIAPCERALPREGCTPGRLGPELRMSRRLVLKQSKSGSGVWAPFPLNLDQIWKDGRPFTSINE